MNQILYGVNMLYVAESDKDKMETLLGRITGDRKYGDFGPAVNNMLHELYPEMDANVLHASINNWESAALDENGDVIYKENGKAELKSYPKFTIQTDRELSETEQTMLSEAANKYADEMLPYVFEPDAETADRMSLNQFMFSEVYDPDAVKYYFETEKYVVSLADTRRGELYYELQLMPDQDLCEAVQAHFESHSTLPNETSLKDAANKAIKELENGPFVLTADEGSNMAYQFAETRIRETRLVGNDAIDFDGVQMEPFDEYPAKGTNATIYVKQVEARLENMDDGNVAVYVQNNGGNDLKVGTLPEKFLINNPMNIDTCPAELQVTDYSNGKMKNISISVVVDTDKMSGDVIDLNEEMLKGLNQDTVLTQ